MTRKQQCVRILFGIQVLVVFGLYVFGSQGIMALTQFKKELKKQEDIAQALSDDIKKLESEHDGWKNDSFYVEKHAREKLAMAREGEKIYLTTAV